MPAPNDLATFLKKNPNLDSGWFSGPIKKTIELWVYNSEKQLLCGRHSAADRETVGRWQAYLSKEVGERESYLESCVHLITQILKLEVNFALLTEIHLRLNASATVFAQVFAISVPVSDFSPPPPPEGLVELKWMSLYEIELNIKNKQFIHPMDYRVVEFLKNP